MRPMTPPTERSWTSAIQPRAATLDRHYPRQAFHRPRTSLGAAGHWIHLLGVAAPVVIGEIFKSPEARWRALRLTAVGTALLSEAVWTLRLHKDRHKDEETRAALKSCVERG